MKKVIMVHKNQMKNNKLRWNNVKIIKMKILVVVYQVKNV